ncbi:MAG: agmatine deiminase family protein, partial [Verrucomicrobia bacterium]|nr:agmatine deiminase family protein [Verrucomicrobiota bacterium]
SQVEQTLLAAEKDLDLACGKLQFFNHPTNDVWVRDYGPIYLRHSDSGKVALTEWEYTAWGGKYPFELDKQIPARIREATGVPGFQQSLVLEGGAIEPNGVGDLLVTNDCLSNPNRNRGVSKEEIETALTDTLGVSKVHWLDGCIEGDDTNGHIDNLVRFFKPDGILLAEQPNKDDANYDSLARLGKQCREIRLNDGRSLEVVNLPLPEAVYGIDRRLPMSYLNFFIGNEVVYAPAYGQPGPDSRALEILESVFPGRAIVPIDCRDLIREGGALHCLTQQVPQTS